MEKKKSLGKSKREIWGVKKKEEKEEKNQGKKKDGRRAILPQIYFI